MRWLVVLSLCFILWSSSFGLEMFVCEGEVDQLQCEEGNVLTIGSAIYGRTTQQQCYGYGDWVGFCGNPNYTTTIVRDMCDGKQVCEVYAGNERFGDPCPGIYKLLIVNYQCTPEVPPECSFAGLSETVTLASGDRTNTVRVGFEAHFACTNSERPWLYGNESTVCLPTGLWSSPFPTCERCTVGWTQLDSINESCYRLLTSEFTQQDARLVCTSAHKGRLLNINSIEEFDAVAEWLNKLNGSIASSGVWIDARRIQAPTDYPIEWGSPENPISMPLVHSDGSRAFSHRVLSTREPDAQEVTALYRTELVIAGEPSCYVLSVPGTFMEAIPCSNYRPAICEKVLTQPKQCSLNVVPPSVSVLYTNRFKPVDPGVTVVFDCTPGYKFVGNHYATCGNNGQFVFDGPMPQCYQLPLPPIVEVATLSEYDGFHNVRISWSPREPDFHTEETEIVSWKLRVGHVNETALPTGHYSISATFPRKNRSVTFDFKEGETYDIRVSASNSYGFGEETSYHLVLPIDDSMVKEIGTEAAGSEEIEARQSMELICPSGWTLINSSCYAIFIDQRRNYYEASKHCNLYDAKVASPNSELDYHNLNALLVNSIPIERDFEQPRFWLDILQVGNRTDGTFDTAFVHADGSRAIVPSELFFEAKWWFDRERCHALKPGSGEPGHPFSWFIADSLCDISAWTTNHYYTLCELEMEPPVQCLFDSLDNRNVTALETNHTFPVDVNVAVTFECESPADEIQGSEVIECLADGSWNTSLPICVDAPVSCSLSEMPSTVNAKVKQSLSLSTGQKLSRDSRVGRDVEIVFSCRDGSIPDVERAMCMADGYLSNSFPACIECTDGWTKLGGDSCYFKDLSTRRNKKMAEEFCSEQRIGENNVAYLVSINSEAELVALSKWMPSADYEQNGIEIWTDVEMREESTRLLDVEHHDGSYPYLNWLLGQPNKVDQRCTVLTPFSATNSDNSSVWKMFDYGCFWADDNWDGRLFTIHALCEYEIRPPVQCSLTDLKDDLVEVFLADEDGEENVQLSRERLIDVDVRVAFRCPMEYRLTPSNSTEGICTSEGIWSIELPRCE